MAQGLATSLQSHGMSAEQATRQSYERMALLMQQQATAVAFKDVVAILAIVVACLTPLAFLMKRSPEGQAAAPPAH